MVRFALFFCVAALGCAQQEMELSAHQGSGIAVRIAVSDQTERRAPRKGTEVWIRGFGSWFPDMRHGGDVKVLGRKPAGVEQELFIYPDGREGTEIETRFRMTSEMCRDGCARDTIFIYIEDGIVEVGGTSLVGEMQQKFPR